MNTKPKLALCGVLTDPDDRPLRPVQIQPGVWICAYAPDWATAEQAADIMRLFLGADVEILDDPETDTGGGDRR